MNTKRWIALIAAAVLLMFSLGLNSIIALFKTDFLSSFESALGERILQYMSCRLKRVISTAGLRC